MQYFAKAIVLLYFLIQIKGAASTASFLPSGFAFWLWQSSIVVGDWLYIDGGEIWAKWYNLSSNASSVWNQQTIAIDLSSSWTTTSIATSVVENKTNDMSPMRLPDLYYDPTNDFVYALGGSAYQLNGYAYDFNVPVQLWGFQLNNGHANWEIQATGPTQNFPLTSVVQHALTATSPKGHYNLGGRVYSSGQSWIYLDEMVEFNFANQSWINRTLSGQYSYGDAQFIPIFGQEGVVLFFGGDGSMIELDNILVYDIHSDTFYNQPATNAPLGRTSFCSVVAGTNSTNSSYEIFIYGGITSTDPSNFMDELSTVYILTLPAFHWLAAPNMAPTGRFDHTCSLIGNRQMLSIGGVYPTQEWQVWPMWTDPWANGLGIFDLTALTWTNAYNHTAAAYEPSGLVTSYYSNHSRYPSWADWALQTIFETDNGTVSTTSSPTSIPTPSDTGTSSSTSGQGRTGAIVGGVVGGVVALAIIGAVLFCYMRKINQTPVEMETDQKRVEMETNQKLVEMEANRTLVEMEANLATRAQLPTKEDLQAMPVAIYEVDGNEYIGWGSTISELYVSPEVPCPSTRSATGLLV